MKILLVLLLVITGAGSMATTPEAALTHTADEAQRLATPHSDALVEPSNTVAQACCKICRKGKACGNSCIARHYTCTKPRGCACDGNVVEGLR